MGGNALDLRELKSAAVSTRPPIPESWRRLLGAAVVPGGP
jgi:hypothetical protein